MEVDVKHAFKCAKSQYERLKIRQNISQLILSFKDHFQAPRLFLCIFK